MSTSEYSNLTLNDSLKSTDARIADFILRANAPIEIQDTELITIQGETGELLNKDDFINWAGPIPLSDYPLNEDASPEIVRKKPDKTVVYQQEVAIRYLRPPTPPAPGDIIIKQVVGSNIPPAPPLVIRQQPPRPETPVPLIIREAPPKQPQILGQKVISVTAKNIPPPPRKVNF